MEISEIFETRSPNEYTKKNLVDALNYHIQQVITWYTENTKTLPSITLSAISDKMLDTFNEEIDDMTNNFAEGNITKAALEEYRFYLYTNLVDKILYMDFDRYVRKLKRRYETGKKRQRKIQ